VKRANANLDTADLPPLPAGLTPHNLPRTFASVLYALGESPPVVMAEMGHTSAALALKAYTKSIARGDGDQAQLAALVEGADWANTGEQPLVAASELVAGGAAA
jgi:integrase